MELNLPSILTPDLGLLFWMLVAFLVVFGVLAKFGFPAILGMVEASARLENIKQESETILQGAREQQAAILQQAAATRDAIVAKAQDNAREEAARLITEAKAEIEAQKQAAISDIRKQVAALSVQISEKILKEKLSTDKAQMDFIDRMLDEVTSNNK